MNQQLKQAWSTKCVAVGFISLTLLGQVWVMYAVIGQDAPSFVILAMELTILWLVFSAVAFGIQALTLTRQLPPEDEGDHRQDDR